LQLPIWAFPMNWPVLLRPELIKPGTRVINQFRIGPALSGELGLDPPIKALFVYNSNPVVVAPEQAKTRAGLAREDLFTVVSDQGMALAALDWSAPALQGIDMERLKREGWARLSLPAADEFAPHAEGNFPTPSGKCEFVASMAAGGNFVVTVFREGSNEFQPGEPVDPLPNYIPPRESPQTNPAKAQHYPLSMLSPKSHAFLNSG